MIENAASEKAGIGVPLSVGDALKCRMLQIACFAFTASTLTAYHPVLAFWWEQWTAHESYYSHGPFVVIASAFVVWSNRRKLACQVVEPFSLGYVVMVIAALGAWTAGLSASSSVMGFTLPLFLYGSVIAVFGRGTAGVMRFPLFFLWFAAVLPDSLLTALSFKAQMLSASTAAMCLNTLGIQANANGALIRLGELTVSVAGACSGLRLVVSMFAIAVFLGYIRRGHAWSKTILVLSAPVLAFAVNTVRIVLVAVVGRIWGEQALVRFHALAGYLVLLLGAAALLTVARIAGCKDYKPMLLS